MSAARLLPFALLVGCGSAQPLAPLRSPLSLERPVAQIAADLARFVPERLERSGVPGCSIAVVRGGEVAWAGGFGVANVLTRAPVTPDTRFEVASISKVVAAYAALKLVGSGALDLDRPLDDYLEHPFLPDSPERDAVTLRRVLSHTSGLSNLLVGLRTDTRIWLPPGERFSYSGHGFTYLERVIESVSGHDFSGHVSRAVLRDLDMRGSAYELDEELRTRSASPHVSALPLLGSFGVLFALGWLSSLGARVVLRRVRRPRATSRARGGPPAAGLVLATAAMVGILGLDDPTMLLAVLALLWGTSLVGGIGVAAAVRAGALPRARSPIASASVAAMAALGLLWVSTLRALPLPLRELDFRAAGGLHSTATDVGRLLVELMDPTRLDPTLGAEMIRPQVRVSEHLSWGLGIGIQHAEPGDSIWHWGQSPGVESLVVGYPAHGVGVVVLTNGGPALAGLELARDAVHRAIGGHHLGYWSEVPGTFLPACGSRSRAEAD